MSVLQGRLIGGDVFLPGPPLGSPDADVCGVGVSHYVCLTDPACDVGAFARRTRDLGSRHTRVAFLLDAWAIGEAKDGAFLPGQYDGYLPWRRLSDGRFDLMTWNEKFWRRLDRSLDAFARCGIHVVLTCFELYTWSQDKSGKLWVPDRDKQPVRHNVNGVRWGDPDDDAGGYFVLPDEAHARFLTELVQHVEGRAGVSLETANESPEKELHYRIRDTLRAAGYTGAVQVNRNEDTPGQAANMKIGRDFERLAIHGREDLSYLDENFQPSYPGPEAERDDHPEHDTWKHWKFYEDNPTLKTFRLAIESRRMDPSRVVMSTDGVGFNQSPYYDRDALVALVADHKRRGMAVEHQARELKLGRFLFGRYDLDDLDVDLIRRMVAA